MNTPDNPSSCPSRRVLPALVALAAALVPSVGRAADEAPPEGASSDLQLRVARVREALQDQPPAAALQPDQEAAPSERAWWHNWGNWHNGGWHNGGWNNWHNWRNWHNWGNW